MPKQGINEVKAYISERTGIPPEFIIVTGQELVNTYTLNTGKSTIIYETWKYT